MELPKRKPNRIPHFDYSTPGAYFVTICTKNRQNIFWGNVGASIARPQTPRLSHAGQIVEQAIQNIEHYYPAITLDHYVVMPNHIHLLLQINTDENGRPMVAPTISTVIQQMKGFVSNQLGVSFWQKLFHDHVIRNEHDYRIIWEYIDNNPAQWELDCFYSD